MTRPRARRALLLLAAACAGAAALSARWDAAAVARPADKEAEARAAFLDVYKVLMHPRCMNCHPSGDAPLQGDDSHRHLQNVKRGEDGKGKYALKCANCHQDTNLAGANIEKISGKLRSRGDAGSRTLEESGPEHGRGPYR